MTVPGTLSLGKHPDDPVPLLDVHDVLDRGAIGDGLGLGYRSDEAQGPSHKGRPEGRVPNHIGYRRGNEIGDHKGIEYAVMSGHDEIGWLDSLEDLQIFRGHIEVPLQPGPDGPLQDLIEGLVVPNLPPFLAFSTLIPLFSHRTPIKSYFAADGQGNYLPDYLPKKLPSF